MPKALYNNLADFSMSAHWNRAQLEPAPVRAGGTAQPLKTPHDFSAPHYKPSARDAVLATEPDMSSALKLGREVVERVSQAVPWLGTDRASQALRQAAQLEGAPAHVQDAVRDAQAISTLAQAGRQQAAGLIRRTAQAVRMDPLGSLRQLAEAHIQAQHDAGYRLAQTADAIYKNPQQLLSDPGSLAMLVAALGATKVVALRPGVQMQGGGPMAQSPSLPISYRSQNPSEGGFFDVPTGRGVIQVEAKAHQGGRFNVATLAGEGHAPRRALLNLSGRNRAKGELELLSFNHDPLMSRAAVLDDLVTSLLWVQTGPQHGLAGKMVLPPRSQGDLALFHAHANPRESTMIQLFEQALSVLGYEVGGVEASRKSFNLNARRMPAWVMQTQPASNARSSDLPQLNPGLPHKVSASRIAPVNPQLGGQQGAAIFFSASGSVLPAYGPNQFNASHLRSLERQVRQHGQDPLNPVYVFPVERVRGAGEKGRAHLLPINPTEAAKLLAIVQADHPLALTRLRADLTSDRRQMIEAAQRYTGLLLRSSD